MSNIRSRIMKLCKRNNYREAKRLKDENKDIYLGWLAENVEQNFKLEEALTEYIGKAENRLVDVGFDLSENAVIGNKSPGTGLISVACLIHEFNDTNIFEKIFSTEGSFLREKALLETASSLSVNVGAPRYLGSYSGKGFYSIYSDCVGIKQPEDYYDKVVAKFKLAEELWMAPQEKFDSIASLAFPCKYDRALANTGTVTDLISVGREVNVSEDYIRKAIELVENSPRCIFHGDFHDGNVLYDGQRFYLIDWDKWSVSRVGSGLRLTSSELLKLGSFNALLDNFRANGSSPALPAVNFFIYNAIFWLQKDKSETASYLTLLRILNL